MNDAKQQLAMPLGATLHTGDLPFGDIVRYAQRAEALGLEGMWLLEESGKEAFATLGVLAGTTTHISLGTSIVSYFTRTPTLLAMAARTLDELSGGRFTLGIGPGGKGFIERGHGISGERPLRRAEEAVSIIRGLLTSKRFSYDGEIFRIQEFRLREGPAPRRIPIILSALNPKMMALSARVADGFVASFPSLPAVDEWRGIVDREARAAGREPGDIRMMALLLTCADPNDEAAVQALRRGLAFYCAAPTYHHIAEISGLGDQVRRVWEAWKRREFDEAARLVTDPILENFGLIGTPAACRKRLLDLRDAGLYPIIYPLPRPGRVVEDHLGTLDLVASYLAP
jgi:alkanesulfonate monooxygenase SsuD/methylene tetrahydromethanopterin reductase-like flavin-dependent oxidoreductase (luciferase family)